MDHSFSGVVVYNGRSYRFERPARRLRDPSADYVRNYRGQRVSYEWVLPGPKRARVATSHEAINRLLREVRAGDADTPSSEKACAVCLEDYAAEATISAMPVCAHAFHHHCISEWLSRNAVCPICRRELPLPTQQDDDDEPPPPHDQAGGDEEDEHDARRRSWNWTRVPISARAGSNW